MIVFVQVKIRNEQRLMQFNSLLNVLIVIFADDDADEKSWNLLGWAKIYVGFFSLIWCNVLIIVRWQHPNLIANSWVVTPEWASKVAFKDWRSKIWGGPLRGRSWRDRSPSLNLANNRSQVRSIIASRHLLDIIRL